MKIGTFYRTSILQNNAARLLLISCDIFNVLLALYHISIGISIILFLLLLLLLLLLLFY